MAKNEQAPITPDTSRENPPQNDVQSAWDFMAPDREKALEEFNRKYPAAQGARSPEVTGGPSDQESAWQFLLPYVTEAREDFDRKYPESIKGKL